MAKVYTVWGSNPEKGNRFDKAEEWIAALFESEEEANDFKEAESKNYKFIEQTIYDTNKGIRVASGFHSARIFCEDMTKNKAKKELLNLNTRCSAYFNNPIEAGSYVKFDKNGFVDGKGYDFYSNEDNKIQESKRTLKSFVEVKLFEEFINEARQAPAKKLFKMIVNGSTSEIEGVKISKDMAQAALDWFDRSTYARKYEKQVKTAGMGAVAPLIFGDNWGIKKTISSKLKTEFKELQTQYKRAVTESVNESATDLLADEIDDAKVYDAFSDGQSVNARSTAKTWDDGVPVLKYIARASKKSVKLPKEFKVVDYTKYGWWYFFSAGKWHGIQQKDYGTPPFEY